MQEGSSVVVMAIVSALVCGIIGFIAVGSGSAMVLQSVMGSGEGGPAMVGFIFIGPIGGIAGALLGVGLALRFGGGSSGWGKGLMVGAGVVTVLAGIVLAVVSSWSRGPSYSYVIEFQLEYPAATLAGVNIPSANAMWGAAGADLDGTPVSQFFEKRCEGDVCVVDGHVAAVGPTVRFHITSAIAQRKYRYPLELPAVVNGPVDWCDWRPGDGARVRWRIVKS
jgi:hypothetical protein